MYHRNDELCVFIQETMFRLKEYLQNKNKEIEDMGISSFCRGGDLSIGFTLKCKNEKMHTIHLLGFSGHIEVYEAHEGMHTNIKKFNIEEWKDEYFKVELDRIIQEYGHARMD